MEPAPHKQLLSTDTPPSDGERVVISGMSGLYPQSRNVKEFANILYNKVNPIGRRTYNLEHPELVQYSGNSPDHDLFDAQFFGIHYHLACSMDSMCRKILEHSYQAIYDAGVNPVSLSEKKVGVYVGSSYSAFESSFYADNTGFAMLGCSKTMFANRVSYWLNVKGPSMTIDEASCSSTEALNQAYQAMRRGDCEAAVVAGSFLCLQPQYSVLLSRTVKMCRDGRPKVFTENADGSAESEAINVLFLQKSKDAVRIYADLINVKCEYLGLLNEETGPKYGFHRKPGAVIIFLKKFYDETKVLPQAIEYVEAFGAAIAEIDKEELDTIDEFFCNNREGTLLVGSVMSNIGYNEAATGISAVTKVLLGYHTGELAPNLHCEHPRQDVACLREGRVQIVTEKQPWQRGYVAVNGMSITGINSHVLLHGYYKRKDLSHYKSSIPYLVPISGRQDSAVKYVIESLKFRPIDPEELALLHNIHQYNTSGHLGRGYVILSTDAEQNTVSLGENSSYFDDARRPLWFVYSGMGSQWPTMGAALMRIPIFAEAIQRCHKVLQPKGLNIVDIITLPDKNIFDNILHSFIGIAAIQIGLTDVLNTIGLVPDGIIGHSVGELGCAYADGCMTAEEMILSAYSRGLVSLQTPFIRGSMAAVAMGYSQVMSICPSEIEVACHNGPESCTISGPAEAMTKFVTELTAKGIFAKEVPCSNIAYHSRYIASAGPGLLKYLKEVIPNPKPRSEKWISSSVPQDRWDEPLAKYSSAEYHTNNLLSPVLFEETSRLIPSNAVLVEVAPHGLLQAILKRSLSPNCQNIPMTRRNHPDNVVMLLNAIGTIYSNGYSVKVQNLYPKVEFPVSTGTPLLSHLVEWAHGEYWPIPSYKNVDWLQSACCKFVISLFDREHKYLRGNRIRGQILYPFAAALVSVWDTLAMVMEVPKKQLSVQFRDVYLYSQPILHDRRQLSLYIVLHRVSGNFEIMDDTNSKVATGFISPVNTKTRKILKDVKSDRPRDKSIQSTDLYQWFDDKGYKYSDSFRSIVTASSSLCQAELVRDENWVTLIDGILQLHTLRQFHSSVSVPTSIKSLGIDVEEHNRLLSIGQKIINIEYSETHDLTRCSGLMMESILFTNLPGILQHDVLLQSTSDSNVYVSGGDLDMKSCNLTLVSTDIGDYNSLQWVESPEPSASNGVYVKVEYAGITNTDFKKASGAIPFKSDSDNAYGMDFSGVLLSGERVMGIVPKGACSKHIQAIPELLWPVPAHWSSEEAATVPFSYLHAIYLLMSKGRLEPNMNVLIHGGMGALGQAAISVALAHNCTVFTTVSDVHKKRFLLKLFPKLRDEHIGNSREASFKDTVLTATKGKGCEIILSSLKGELKQNNFECCAFSGVVIDPNQLHDHENFDYGMAAMFKQRSYCLSDFSNLIISGDGNHLKELRLMLSEGIARGFVRPLTHSTFAPQQASRAFRMLAASAHRGRVLLDMRSEANTETLTPNRRIICDADSFHIIISSENSLGLQLAERLILRGAKRLAISLKSGATGVVYSKIQSWKDQGLEVVVGATDLNSVEKNNDIIYKTASLSTVEGIYLVNIVNEEIVLSLEKLARNHCPSLKYFGVICTVGNTGKNVCTTRRQCSLPGTMLYLPEYDEETWTSRNEWYNFAVEAIERAMRSHETVLVARPVKMPQKMLLQELAELVGITIQGTTNETTLRNLGLEDDNLILISNFLRTKYNLYYDATQLSGLTIERIVSLDNVVRHSEFSKLEGLSQHIKYVEHDELAATTDLVPLPTLVSGALGIDFNVDHSKMNLVIVPGLEGQPERFRFLCERLKVKALVLQLRLDKRHETLQDMAKIYAEVLLSKAGLNETFYLLGYESGTAMALEIAGILEDYGLTGTIFCLGCTANDFQDELKKELEKYNTDGELQDAILSHMLNLITGSDTATMTEAFKNIDTWKDKVDEYVRILLRKVSHSAQYARDVIEATLARIKEIQKYQVTERKLRSKIVYLPATGYCVSGSAVLQQYTEQPLVVHQLSAPLPHATLDLRCANVINDCLPRDIIENHDNGNSCEMYAVQSENFTIRTA